MVHTCNYSYSGGRGKKILVQGKQKETLSEKERREEGGRE
jgi:hypothetical protein